MPGVPTKDQTAAAKAVQAYLGITQKDLSAGTDTFQTSVSTLASPDQLERLERRRLRPGLRGREELERRPARRW